MSEKLPVDKFTWETDLSIFTDDFIKNYDSHSDMGYIFFVDITYPQELYESHKDLPFLRDRMEVNKVDKLVDNAYDKTNYVIHINALKQALNHGLILKKIHSVISFNHAAWLKPCIDMNTELRTNAKNDFEKDYFKLKNNSAFGKTMENIRKHRDIRLVNNNKKRKVLASEPNYHATKPISEDLLIMEMKKRELYMNKPIYLGQTILDISKTLMYEFCYDYIKPKYANNVELCYVDTDSFVMKIKKDDFYKDISNYVEKWFDTSNFDVKDNKPLPIGKNRKLIGKFKDELGGKVMSEFCALKAKTYAFKLDNDNEVKKAKGTKKCIVKNHITFNGYVNTLFNDNKLLKSQFTFKSDHHKIYTRKINKIALNYFDDKRIQCSDKIATYPYGYFNNNSNINSEIKDNTVKLDEIDNSGIIPRNYNTKDPLKNTNVTLDINEIIEINNDIYADSAKSACIDKIKSTNVNNNCSRFSKTFCADIIKKACYEIINESIYADSAKSTCIDSLKRTNYLDTIKSTFNDTIKNKFSYADSVRSTCKDKIKSTFVNINYLDTSESTYTDSVKSANIKIIKQKSNIARAYCKNINNKRIHSTLLTIKKVSNTNIIIKKKLNPQVINIKYELNALNKLEKVSNASKNLIDLLNKHITQIIKGDKVHTHNEINNTVTRDNIKKAHIKSAIPINKVHKIILLVILAKKHIKSYLRMCLSK